jgi:hypothetical protein
LIGEAVTPQAVQTLRPKVAQLVEEMLEPLLERGRMDVIGDFARTLPTQVAAVWLGVPTEDRAQMVEWIFPLVAGRGVARDPVTTAAANRAADAFLAYFRELVTRRRSTPEDDLITSLLHAQGAGNGFFTDEDLLGLIVCEELFQLWVERLIRLVPRSKTSVKVQKTLAGRHESDLFLADKLSYTQPRKPISPARATMITGLVLVKIKISAQRPVSRKALQSWSVDLPMM